MSAFIKKIIRLGPVEFEFVWIEPGKNELPSGDLEIEEGYWVLSTPVTQEQWEIVMGENPAEFKGENRPVESVSYDMVQEFLKNFNDLLPTEKADLPTSTEWEYACRAGTKTKYSFGDSIDSTQANYGNNVGETTPVKTYPPNDWGLYDMHGNVWEWTKST